VILRSGVLARFHDTLKAMRSHVCGTSSRHNNLVGSNYPWPCSWSRISASLYFSQQDGMH
jgi:hypothetical protein